MIPEHLWATVADPEVAGEELAVGTGPYRLVDYQPSQLYRFEANRDYALGTPALDTVVMPVIPEPATAFAALRAGEVDATSESLEPQLVEQFRADPALTLLESPSFSLQLLALNTERAGLDQVAVRQAVSRAIDVDRLVEVVLLGSGIPGDPGFLHPESPLSAVETKHRYDPAEARTLLDQAGAVPGPDGIRVLNGAPLAYTLLAYANDPQRVRMAELIRDMLGEVGIGVTVQTQEMAAVDDLVWPGIRRLPGPQLRHGDVAVDGAGIAVQRQVRLAGALLAGRGQVQHRGFTQPRADALVDELGSTVDETRRTELVAELQRLIAEQVPIVPLLWPLEQYAVRAEAFDDWVVQKGAGIVNRSSFVADG